eukprot:2372013-Pyramimonas_sp.AAC.1
MSTSPWRARVRATLMRRGSSAKPSRPLRTVEITTTSASRPCVRGVKGGSPGGLQGICRSSLDA